MRKNILWQAPSCPKSLSEPSIVFGPRFRPICFDRLFRSDFLMVPNKDPAHFQPPQCDNDPGHLQHVELAFPGDHAPTMVPIFKLPDFPSNIPFDRMSRKELREPDFGHHTEHYSRERESGGSSREGSQFDDIPRREKAFFGPIDKSVDFER